MQLIQLKQDFENENILLSKVVNMTEDNGRGRVFKSSSVAVAVNNKVESWRKKENSLFFRTATNINNNEEQVRMQEMQNTKQAEEKVKYYLDDDLMTIEILKLGHQQMHKGVSLGLWVLFYTRIVNNL